MKEVLLEVTDKGAIYVNDTRITDRSTKWGLHTIIFSRMCRREDVVKTLKEFRYSTKKIDEPYYIRQIEQLATQQ
jgi:hypothetical protein